MFRLLSVFFWFVLPLYRKIFNSKICMMMTWWQNLSLCNFNFLCCACLAWLHFLHFEIVIEWHWNQNFILDDENATDLGLFSETMSRESSESSAVFPPNAEEQNPPTTTPPKSAPARHSPPASKLPTAIPRPTTASTLRKSPPAVQKKTSPPAATSTPTRVGSGVVTLKKSPNVKKAALGTSANTANNNNNSTNTQSRSQISPNQMTHHFRSHRNDFATLSPKNLNISLDFLTEVDEKGQKYIADENSGMFLYIDLHGHASKKGIFMYGNHLPTTQEAVECMLLPRLMSLNCQHFHFDACNFSEKNMYLK